MSMSVEEGNKMIARFMGVHFSQVSKQWVVKPGELRRELEYHSSWGALMPVVEKISKTKIAWENSEDVDYHYPRTFGMISEQGEVMVRFNGCALSHADTLIEATWLSVIDYIQTWHTKQKQP